MPSEVIAGKLKIHEVVTAVEVKGFYDGFYFAKAFNGDSYKATWYTNLPCKALEEGVAGD